MRFETPEGFCSIPSATGGIARLACARLRELGKDVAGILAKVGARPEQVNDDAVRLEVPKQIRILELVAEELQDDLLGFHLARNFDLREIGLVYYVITSSERFADALLNGKRYSTIVNEGVRLNVKLDDRAVAIALDYVDVDRQSDRHQIEFWLVTVVRICRKVTETRLAPRHLRVRHRRDETPAEMRSFFGCDVEFGAASDEIIFAASVASLPIVGSDNCLNDLLVRYAEEALADRPQERASLRSAVERVVPQLLPHAKASAPNVAKKLGISPRTLSRKLRDERVAFPEILEETRVALAKRYLVERDLPVSEIAWLLGYSEISSFTHAFKRWTGITPREFRSTPASLYPAKCAATLKAPSACGPKRTSS
jgi:AraC-like DNA-binding protein